MNTARPTRLMMTHDPLAAFEHLSHSAREYLATIARGYPVPEMRRLAIAAVAFTAQVAIEYGYDVEIIRAMERDLVARLESGA